MYLFSYLVGTSGRSWRTRNNFIQTTSGGFRNKSVIVRKSNSKQLENILH